MTKRVLRAELAPRGCYRLVEFDFKYLPLVLDKALDDDVVVYRKCCEQCGMTHPGWSSLLFMGEAAEGLFLRRAGSSDRWDSFRRLAALRDPAVRDADDRTVALTAAVAALATGNPRGARRPWIPSLFEVRFGSALMTQLSRRPELVLRGDQHLAQGGLRRADFVLGSRGEFGATVRVEVAGLLDRYGVPRTSDGVDYATRLPARLRAYAAAGVEPPVVVYGDETCDPGLLNAAVRRVFAEATEIQQPTFRSDWNGGWIENRPHTKIAA